MPESSAARTYRYITRKAGIRSGRPFVDGTRIGVHDVVAYHLLGVNVDQIQQCFPDLTRAQIYECLAYFEDHQDQILPAALEQIDPEEK